MLPKANRLRERRDFDRAFKARRGHRTGPLTVHVVPGEADVPRLGLSVPRRVGAAVRRNLIRRRLREAFRSLGLTDTVDIVVHVRPHVPLSVRDYADLVRRAVRRG